MTSRIDCIARHCRSIVLLVDGRPRRCSASVRIDRVEKRPQTSSGSSYLCWSGGRSAHRRSCAASMPASPAPCRDATLPRQFPIAPAEPRCPTSRAFLPWRLSDAGPGASGEVPEWPASETRHTNGPRGHARRTSVDPPIPDEIAAARKSAVPCQVQTHAAQPSALKDCTLQNGGDIGYSLKGCLCSGQGIEGLMRGRLVQANLMIWRYSLGFATPLALPRRDPYAAAM